MLHKLLFLATVSVGLALTRWTIAIACTWGMAPGAKTGIDVFPELLAGSDAVVVARISNERTDGYRHVNRFDATVEKVWKGPILSGQPIVISTQAVHTTCDAPIRPPVRMIMFLAKYGDAYRLSVSQVAPNIADTRPDFAAAVAALDRLSELQR